MQSSIEAVVGLGLVAAAAIILLLRELWRRIAIAYEYRWETFAVRGLRGRQLLHIRRSEIVSVEPLTLMERLFGFGRYKWMTRSGFSRRVVIRSNIAHAKPVVVSWEGRLIAGLKPAGYRLRPEESGSRG